MRALTYHGPRDVRVETVPDPELLDRHDVLLRVTATAICGTDLHLYRGKVAGLEPGSILGHEFMGIVEEVGAGVTRLERGDRIVVPCVVSCGECFFCARSLFAACETSNKAAASTLSKRDLRPGATYFGHPRHDGGLAGGQAELVRVPLAERGALPVPESLSDEQVLFLSDILPTAYQAVLNAEIGPGRSVAIFGAGPVGQLVAACARMLGAARIFIVDHYGYRLDFAARAYGAEPIDFSKVSDPAQHIIEETRYRGVDAAIDAVGFEAKGSTLETVLTNLKIEGSSGIALRQALAATRRGGIVSVAGVYSGFIHGLLFGDAFEKGVTFRMGPTHVQRHMGELLERVANGELHPQAIVTHRLALDDAARGYQLFDRREDGCLKVVLTTGDRR